MMQTLLLSLALGQAGPIQHPPTPMKTLYSFETDAEIQTLKANNTRLTPREQGATEGRRALQVEFLPAEWPNVFFAAKTPWDWSSAGGLAIDITNPGRETIHFHVRIDDDPRADGNVHCRTGTGSIEPGRTETFVMPLGIDPMSVGMRGLPVAIAGRSLGASGWGAFNPGHIVAFQIFLSRPAAPRTLLVDNIRLAPAVSLEGIVDRFGQYAKGDWPGKIKSESELAERRKAEEAELEAQPALPDRDRYGGWTKGPRLQATGWFRTEQVDGKWWLVTPEGRLFFSMGIDCVAMWGSTFITGREKMFSWLPEKEDPLARHFGYERNVHSGPVKEGRTYDFYHANLERKYGRDYEKHWIDISLKRLPAWGFNTIANWSDWKLYNNGRVPYVATAHIGGDHARLTSGSDYWGKMHDPYDPKFVESVRNSVRGAAERIRNDPWCLGIFVDNELSWGGGGEEGGRYGLAYGALSMNAAESPAKRAFVVQLRAKYADITRLNAAWGINLSGWEALEAPLHPEGPSNDARREDMKAFVKDLARRYFRIVREEVKRIAPNHLYLGCRFAWRTQEAVEASAEYCDVVSFNIYAPRVDPREWGFANNLGKPCIIGEFHFGALDRGMFHTGLVAAPDQKTRAAMYQDYLHSVLDHPAFVGCHWFQYIDEPLTGRTYDGENYNIGFLSVTDTPYPEMVAAAKAVHREAYARRFGASRVGATGRP